MGTYNSVRNQKIKEAFVNREIHANLNILVEYVLGSGFENRDAPFTIDEVENLYCYQDEDGNQYSESQKESQVETWKEQVEQLEDQLSEDEDNGQLQGQIDALNEQIGSLENTGSEIRDVYEWWLVSDWLAEKLKSHGEVMVSDGWNQYWGRCTTGQAILLDYVISKICEDMEILEGQQYEWK